MKKIIICTENRNIYIDVIEKVKSEVNYDVTVQYTDSYKNIIEMPDLIILEVAEKGDLENIKIECPSLIVSKKTTADIVCQAYKIGATDFACIPLGNICAEKIKRILNSYSAQDIVSETTHEWDIDSQMAQHLREVIKKDIKLANRGKYAYSLMAIKSMKDTEIRGIENIIIEYMEDIDTPLVFKKDLLMISMPFCSHEASIIMREKINRVLKDKFKLKAIINSVTLGIDGETSEELINELIEKLKHNRQKTISAV